MDGEVLVDLLDEIQAKTPIDTIGGDGAYGSYLGSAERAPRRAQHSVPPLEGLRRWSDSTVGAAFPTRPSMSSKRAVDANGKSHAASRRSLAGTLIPQDADGTHTLGTRDRSQATEMPIRGSALARRGPYRLSLTGCQMFSIWL